MLTVLVLLLLSSSVSALQLQPQIRLSQQTGSLQTTQSGLGATTALRLKADDDEDERRPMMDMQDDVLTRRVGVKSLDELQPKKVSIPISSFSAAALEKQKEEEAKKKKGSFGSKTFGSISMEDLTADTYTSPTGKVFTRGKVLKKESMDGIQPLKPLVFSVVAVGMSYVSWQVSVYLAANFAIQLLGSDLYPVQRIAVIGRNLVVGIFTLFSGFTGMIALGLVRNKELSTYSVCWGPLEKLLGASREVAGSL
jgi:hypothetical protein